MEPVVGGGPLVITAAVPMPIAGIMVKFWVALGRTPLLAVTVPVELPIPVGVPEITPAKESESPLGSDPVVTKNVGVGLPVQIYGK